MKDPVQREAQRIAQHYGYDQYSALFLACLHRFLPQQGIVLIAGAGDGTLVEQWDRLRKYEDPTITVYSVEEDSQAVTMARNRAGGMRRISYYPFQGTIENAIETCHLENEEMGMLITNHLLPPFETCEGDELVYNLMEHVLDTKQPQVVVHGFEELKKRHRQGQPLKTGTGKFVSLEAFMEGHLYAAQYHAALVEGHNRLSVGVFTHL